MLIEADKINEKGFHLSDTVELDGDLLIEEGSVFMEEVTFSLAFIRVKNKIEVKGSIKTNVSLKCIRCLEYYEQKIDSKFDLILFPAGLIEMTNTALNPDEMEYIFYEGNRIDLEKLLMEQVNLFIPYHPICDRKCKGICPNCGQNLNTFECKCDHSIEDINLLFDKIKR